MASPVSFRVTYSGAAVQDGTMDVRELAPALLALGKLCEESNRVLNQSSVAISVKVSADFQSGSFIVDLELVQSLLEQARSLFQDSEFTDAKQLCKLIFGGGGLIGVLRWLRGRQPTIKTGEKGTTIVAGDVHLHVDKLVIPLLEDPSVREQASKMVQPLEKDGIEEVRFSQKESEETVSREEVHYFRAPDAPEERMISEISSQFEFAITSLSFKEGNKWRLSDGEMERHVLITDQEFLEKIERNQVSFSKGDRLRVELITRQLDVLGTLRTEYKARRILHHQPAAPKMRQLSLDEETEPE